MSSTMSALSFDAMFEVIMLVILVACSAASIYCLTRWGSTKPYPWSCLLSNVAAVMMSGGYLLDKITISTKVISTMTRTVLMVGFAVLVLAFLIKLFGVLFHRGVSSYGND